VTARRLAVVWVAALAVTAMLGAPAGASTSPGAPQGNVTPSTTATTKVDVVAQSAPVDGRVALLVQNGTSRPVRVERITAVATRPDGGLATRAETRAVYPQVLAPGDLALAAVAFPKRTRSDVAVEAKVRSTTATVRQVARALSVGDFVLSPPLTGDVAQTLDVTVTNGTSAWTARARAIAVVCFGESGLPSTFAKARVASRRIRPGDSTPATVRLRSLCPTYLVAARTT
jgi:hypothetical protein